jgi:hypothetical protein
MTRALWDFGVIGPLWLRLPLPIRLNSGEQVGSKTG